MQSACGGHCELLSSADEKVASGRVAAAFCTAITELWFLSTHSGTPQGYHREKEEESKGQARAKEKPEGQRERTQKKGEYIEKHRRERSAGETRKVGTSREGREKKTRHVIRFD